MASQDSTTDNKNAIVIKERIGAGMFGTVHLAETTSGEKRAVKRIPKGAMKTQKHVQNLDREIKILRDADHLNIVKLYGVKKRGNEFWLILEYCGGGDLADFIKAQLPKKRLSEKITLHYFKQLSSGLSFMADRGLIHRDLKPANLLLSDRSSYSTIKIADFGFARELTGSNMAQTLCGTPYYMAPEMLSGQPHDAKVDMYSAGAILFEMLCGRPPFNGRDVPDLIANQRKQLKMPVRVSKECLVVITMLLQRQPARRADASVLASSDWLTFSTESMQMNDSAMSLSTSSNTLNDSSSQASINIVSASSPLNSPREAITPPSPPSGADGRKNQNQNQKEIICNGDRGKSNGLNNLTSKMNKLGLNTVNEESRTQDESMLQTTTHGGGGGGVTIDKEAQEEVTEGLFGDESSEWEVIPTKDQMTADVYLKRSHIVQNSVLNGALHMNKEEELAAVKRVMEYSRKAAECYSVANEPKKVDTVLSELQDFLQHPKVEAALAGSSNVA